MTTWNFRLVLAAAALACAPPCGMRGAECGAPPSAQCGAPSAERIPVVPHSPLQVHLPREVRVEGDALRLGTVAVVRAEDDALARLASGVPLGRAPGSKEQIAIDRPTILGRLASSGIPASSVQLSGADRVVVSRGEKTVPAADLVRAAESCLESQRPAPAGCRWVVARQPADLTVPACEGLVLEASGRPHDVTGEACIEVAAAAGGRRLAAQPVLFKLAYVHREAVAARDLAPGDVLAPENIALRTALAPAPAPADWTPPYGLAAAQAIRAGSVIRPALLRSPRAAAAVRRGENVVMRIQGQMFLLRGLGTALEDSPAGGLIRVRNADSGRVVVARVAGDGAVEPVLGEVK